jgi:ATP-binding cassette subfamily F protein 3
MSVASLSNIEKDFGERLLFDKINLTIYEQRAHRPDRRNGSGKTTLFKIMMGEMTPILESWPSAAACASVISRRIPSSIPPTPSSTKPNWPSAIAPLSHRLRELEHEMAHLEGDALDKILRQYQNAQHEFDLAGGYAWQHKLEATLLGVGLEREHWEQNVQTLSGGQRSRLALAKLLISEPDLLLLDEPTNHLDLAAIEWLERYLLAFNGTTVLISHDRFLLDRLATRILWLRNAKLDSFKGNYSAFVQQRELIELSQQRAYDEQQADIAKQQEFIRRFRPASAARRRAAETRAFSGCSRAIRWSRPSALSGTFACRSIPTSAPGDQVLDVRHLSKAFGEKKLWREFPFSSPRRAHRRHRPQRLGQDHAAAHLLGQIDADDGLIKWGASLNIGYYDQRLDEFNPENTCWKKWPRGGPVTRKRSCATPWR